MTLIKLSDEKLPIRRIEAEILKLNASTWTATNSTIWPIDYGLNSHSNAQKLSLVEIPTSLKKEQITDQFATLPQLVYGHCQNSLGRASRLQPIDIPFGFSELSKPVFS